MTQFTFRFLGYFQIRAGTDSVTEFHSDKARALLVYLALEQWEHSRSSLATLLWPEIGDKYARTNLRNTLYRLRQTLDAAVPDAGDQLLIVTRQTVQFNPVNVFVDVHQLQKFVDTANTITDPSQLEPILELYRGELLTGFHVADAPTFEEWLLLRREMMHQQTLLTFNTLSRAYETVGNYDQSYSVANRLLLLDPYREETHRQIMRLLALMGQPDQALQHLEQTRQLLYRELAVEATEETLALAQQIAAGEFQQRSVVRHSNNVIESQQENETVVQEDTATAELSATPVPLPPTASSSIDLSDIPDPGPFFGRAQERQQIIRWLLYERVRVIAILAIGGMGKTTLTAQCIRELVSGEEQPFDVVLWRSLVNAPPLADLLPPLLQTLSDQQLTALPATVDDQLRLLVSYLRDRRVLLVLDNLESILEPARAGTYRPGYEAYGQLIQQLATLEHQSHLLLTSRERPSGYDRLERDTPWLQSLQLGGLDEEAGHKLLMQRGLSSDGNDEVMLIERYSGNPLALKLVADTVDEIFEGDVAEFLREESLVFDDIRAVLDQHFARLTPLEQEILFWLAIEREPVSHQILSQNLLHAPSRRILLEALRGLQRRSLVEHPTDGFALQNVVTEYLTDRLVITVSDEITNGEPDLLHRHALMKAQTKAYVRQSQIRLILAPLGERLLGYISQHTLPNRMQQMVNQLRQDAMTPPSYAAGNILNLLLLLKTDLQGFDLSHLSVRHAFLRGMRLIDLNLTGADLTDSVFTDTFGGIFAVAIHQAAGLLAAGTTNGEIRLWRLSDRQPLAVLQTKAEPPWSVAFNPDGTLLAGGSGDADIQLWETATGYARQTLTGHTLSIRSVAFSPDGALLASGSEDHTVRIWDVATGQLRQCLTSHCDWIYAVAFSPDGTLLASAGGHAIHLWDLQSLATDEAPRIILNGHTDKVLSLDFHPSVDGSAYILASGAADQTVCLWRVDVMANLPTDAPVELKEALYTLQPQNESVNAVAFSPDGKSLASGGQDGSVRLWDVQSGRPRHTLRGHSNSIRTLAYAANHTLVSGGMDQTIRLWETETGQLYDTIQGHINWALSLTFHPSDNRLISASHDSAIRLWDLAALSNRDAATASTLPTTTLPTYQQLDGHDSWVFGVVISPDGKLLASASVDKTVRIWRLTSANAHQTALPSLPGQLRHTLPAHPPCVLTVAFSPDSTLLASGGGDNRVQIWDSNSGQLRHILTGHTNWVWSIAFSPDGKTLASASSDQTIYLWDTASGEVKQILRGHTSWVRTVAFSHDGCLLASGSEDCTIRLWDVESGCVQHVIESEAGWVMSVAFGPQSSEASQILACGTVEGMICFWDLARAESEITIHPRLQVAGHASRIETVAYRADGKILASGSSDKTIKLWDSQTGDCLQTLSMPGPYEGTNITAVTGISEAQRMALKALGAIEDD